MDHSQANGQVEAINKIIKQILKTKLEARKGAWADELQMVLWAYRMTTQTTIGEILFSIVYGSETMIPVENVVISQRRATFNLDDNNQLLTTNLNLLDEVRELARTEVAIYQ